MDTITVQQGCQYRQGDILLMSCSRVPSGAREIAPESGRVILARGETTGHAHAFAADRVRYFREDGSGQGFVVISGASTVDLTHEEHTTLRVAPGAYRVVRQREYEPKAHPRTMSD